MVKGIFDRIVATLALVLLGPVMLATALLVAIRLGTPVLFVQERPGLGGRIFRLFKFRTMTDEQGPDGELLPDEVRLTSFGRTLRRLSLDELPQLINVLRGELSLVGPRPLLVEYLPLYSAAQARRHDVKPGITGWAQVNGRNAVSWPEKLAMDVWYVDNRTLWLDLRILWMTVVRVFSGAGVSQDGRATTERFRGSA
ncbi:MAG: sugar transferase [Thermoanaerobaculia bacterium]